jgi:DNA (cytosine-5)-methyltransferase 1
MMRFIDLFAGIGGTRMGLEKAGMTCVFSSEWDSHAQDMYELNFGERPSGDITEIDAKDVPDHEVLIAGFPCQPFSISGKKQGFEDTRGTLFFDILRIAEAKRTPILILENVKHLVHHDSGKTLKVILESLGSLGYEVAWKVLNSKNYGVAQNRERIIIVASKRGMFSFDFDKETTLFPIKDMLQSEGDFEWLKPSEYTILPRKMWRKQKSGLIFAGYRNKSIRKAGVLPDTEHLSRVHKQPNRIYSVEGTHPTLPSQESSGRFWIFDGKKVRKLTLDEAFRLMGFPKGYKRLGTPGQCYLRIGNSVCVPMIEKVGKEVAKQLLS